MDNLGYKSSFFANVDELHLFYNVKYAETKGSQTVITQTGHLCAVYLMYRVNLERYEIKFFNNNIADSLYTILGLGH